MLISFLKAIKSLGFYIKNIIFNRKYIAKITNPRITKVTYGK